jgi:hypothetical protein
MARGSTTGACEEEAEEEKAASETLTADSADEEGRRGSSSSASSEAASSTVSYTYSPPDEWQNKVAIKTCVSVVSADVAVAGAGGADDGKEEMPPRGGVDAADRHRASGT